MNLSLKKEKFSLYSLILPVIIALTFSIVLIIAGFFYYDYERKHFQKVNEENLSAIADLKKREIMIWRKEYIANALRISTNPLNINRIKSFIENKAAKDSGEDLIPWIDSLKQIYGFRCVRIIDIKGNTVLSTGLNESSCDYKLIRNLSEIIHDGEPVLSDFYRNDQNNQISIFLLAPLFYNSKKPEPSKYLGLLIFEIDPSLYIYPLIRTWPTPSKTAETLLVQKEGNRVLYLNELRHKKETALKFSLPLTNALLPASMAVRGFEGICEGMDYRGIKVLAYCSHIPNSNWHMIAKIDIEEILDPLYTRTWIIFSLVTSFVIIIGLILLFWFKRRELEFFHQKYKAEVERKALLNHFYYLSKYANDIILLMDENKKIIEANDRACSAYGYTREEILNLYVKDLRVPEAISDMDDIFQNAEIKDGIMYETFHKSKEGRIFPIESSLRVIKVEGIKFFQAIIRDITERKKHEEALKKSETLYKMLYEESSAGILLLNDNGSIIEANPSFNLMLGYELKEIKGKKITDFFCTEELQKMPFQIQKAMTGETVRIERRLIKKDNTCIVTEVVAKRIAENFVQGVYRDITRYKEAEEKIKNQKNFYEIILNSIVNGVWVSDKNDMIYYANNSMTNIAGIPANNIYQANVMKDFPEDTLKFFRPYYLKAKETKTPVYYDAIPVVTPSGRQSYQTGWIIPIVKKDWFEGIICTVDDVTEQIIAYEERIKLEDQLKQAQKMESIGQLAGGVAHDFNNILHIINGYAELIISEIKPEDQIQSYLKTIQKTVERATSLVRQLLLFSRREAMQPKIFDLNKLINNISKILSRVIGEHINLKVKINPEAKQIYADPNQIEQIIMNLSVNSRDAMLNGGSILIETDDVSISNEFCEKHLWAKPGDYVLMTISDTGCGIPREIQDKIFEPFFTTKEVGKGTGLGLAAVYGIIKSHNGMIHLYSEEGHGAVFKIYLPAAQADIDSAINKKSTEESFKGNGEKILLAEDETEVREINSEIMKRAGYNVLLAEDGYEAFSIFEKDHMHIDLVLLDVIMPKLSGQMVLEKIRKIRPDMKVIFMTGYSRGMLEPNIYPDNRYEIIQKPCSSQALLKKIKEILDK